MNFATDSGIWVKINIDFWSINDCIRHDNRSRESQLQSRVRSSTLSHCKYKSDWVLSIYSQPKPQVHSIYAQHSQKKVKGNEIFKSYVCSSNLVLSQTCKCRPV